MGSMGGTRTSVIRAPLLQADRVEGEMAIAMKVIAPGTRVPVHEHHLIPCEPNRRRRSMPTPVGPHVRYKERHRMGQYFLRCQRNFGHGTEQYVAGATRQCPGHGSRYHGQSLPERLSGLASRLD